MQRTETATDRWFTVLVETDRAQAASMTLEPGRSTGGPENAHTDSEQWCYVISGAGRATVDGSDERLGAGDLLVIEAGETHEITASETEPLETLNVYVPPTY